MKSFLQVCALLLLVTSEQFCAIAALPFGNTRPAESFGDPHNDEALRQITVVGHNQVSQVAYLETDFDGFTCFIFLDKYQLSPQVFVLLLFHGQI
jgi:hypothetical protein